MSHAEIAARLHIRLEDVPLLLSDGDPELICRICFGWALVEQPSLMN